MIALWTLIHLDKPGLNCRYHRSCIGTSQTRTALSFPPEARVLPSGAKDSDTIAPEWPCQMECRRLPPVSQSSISPLIVPHASFPPSGENANVIAPDLQPAGASSRRAVEASRSSTPDPGQAVARIRPSGEYATQRTSRKLIVVASRVRIFSPVATSQSFVVPSVFAEASVRPSGENARQLTCRRLPRKSARCRSVAMSQIVMSRSRAPRCQ